MLNFVKKLVAGPKRMMEYKGKHLDLTYISERIIAMAFPACSLLEKIYRNSISDVAQYFNEQHNAHYLIINVSNRLYDYSKFDDKVKDFDWPDHQAPALTTLVHIAFAMFHFLASSEDGVVAIHCNHGKGRTGTAIIAFLLLTEYLNQTEECLKLYNSKRFSSDEYGVDQPCQLRYLKFIQKLKRQVKISPKIPFYRLKKVTHKGLGSKYHVRISRTRDQKVAFDRIPFDADIDKKIVGNMLFSDIFIEIYRDSLFRDRKRIARINYNLFFVNKQTLELTFSSKDIKLEKDNLEDFQITFHFQFFCLCHLSQYQSTKCQCSLIRVHQEMFWRQMIAEINECSELSRKQVKYLVHGKKECEDDMFFKPSQLKKNKELALQPRKTSSFVNLRSHRQSKIYAQMMNFNRSYAFSLAGKSTEPLYQISSGQDSPGITKKIQRQKPCAELSLNLEE